jgi:hypothetical protein
MDSLETGAEALADRLKDSAFLPQWGEFSVIDLGVSVKMHEEQPTPFGSVVSCWIIGLHVADWFHAHGCLRKGSPVLAKRGL